MITVPCRCCGKSIDIELQTRINLRTGEQRTPIFLVTCRNKDCGIGKDEWTFAFERLEDYQQRDLTLYLKGA